MGAERTRGDQAAVLMHTPLYGSELEAYEFVCFVCVPPQGTVDSPPNAQTPGIVDMSGVNADRPQLTIACPCTAGPAGPGNTIDSHASSAFWMIFPAMNMKEMEVTVHVAARVVWPPAARPTMYSTWCSSLVPVYT